MWHPQPCESYISIHAPRTGSDITPCTRIVQSTISIHAPRTGSDGWVEDMYAYGRISIHAPRTGSDAYLCTPHGEEGNFNPRSPHGERQGAVRAAAEWRYFNPRSPHGERRSNRSRYADNSHFNPRSPHGERRTRFKPPATVPISIHAPRTGSDVCKPFSTPNLRIFQSTLPARGATTASENPE